MSEGYSGTPLGKKLGIKSGAYALISNAPDYYFDLFPDWPEDVVLEKTPKHQSLDFIHLFCPDIESLHLHFATLKTYMKKSAMMWISWPKKSSGVQTDINEHIVREYALSNGLVDVKKAAIDQTWSGLKLVFRLKDR